MAHLASHLHWFPVRSEIATSAQDARSPRRALAAIGVAHVALFAFYGGVGLIVQSRISLVDPGGKAGSLALVAVASAVCATVANLVGGALSDRTRTSLGRRLPWLLGGALAATGCGVLLPVAGSVLAIGVAACAALAAANLYHAALAATILDWVGRTQRGSVSALVGVASIAGWAIGTQLAAGLGDGVAGVLVLGAGLVCGVLLFALLAGAGAPQLEHAFAGSGSGAGAAVGALTAAERGGWAATLAAFRHRDFAFVFAGRALMAFSYNLVLVYLLYVLQDWISRPQGMSAATAVATVVTVSGAAAIATALAVGVLADRWRRYRPFMVAAGAGGALALLVPMLSRGWDAFLVFAVLQGAAIGIYYAVDTALATLVLPSARSVARDLGVLNVASAAPPIVAPFVAGLLVTSVGYGGLFPVAAAAALLSAASVTGVRGVR